MNTLSPDTKTEPFGVISNQCAELIAAPHGTNDQMKAVLSALSNTVQELDRVWLSASRDSNILAVKRAVIIGTICMHVKHRLLHGAWTTWAEANFTKARG